MGEQQVTSGATELALLVGREGGRWLCCGAAGAAAQMQ